MSPHDKSFGASPSVMGGPAVTPRSRAISSTARYLKTSASPDLSAAALSRATRIDEAELRQRNLEVLEHALRSGIEDGEIRAELDVAVTARAILALAEWPRRST